ncbi:MAG TPA: hypothetical protein EYO75_01950 [Sulfurimonas sp.]|nr:hypothetical protein [Sulfurimonas sp.]
MSTNTSNISGNSDEIAINRKGISLATAIGMLPDASYGKTSIGMATASFRGATSFAMGISTKSSNGFSARVAASSAGGENLVGGAVGFEF